MKVKDVMTPNPKAIWLTESLADAAKEMWEHLELANDELCVRALSRAQLQCLALVQSNK